MRNKEVRGDILAKGRDISTGTYSMPTVAAGKVMSEIEKESDFRKIATVIRAYMTGYKLFAKDCKDKAEFVAEGATIPVYEGAGDFNENAIGKRIVNIDHQLQRTSDMRYIIETTKTDAGTRKLPITEDVAQMFQAIIEDRVPPKVEKVIDGYSGFLFYDENDMPLVAMHWQHRFNHMVGRYNDIYRVQMPNITPHVCRHTYCSNMAKSGMNPKTLQYLMGHSDISVTMNEYTHIGFDDAEEELKRMEEFRKAQAEIEKKNDTKAVSQKMFKVV